MLPAVKQLFARTLPRLYTPRVKRASKRIGLHDFFVALYLRILKTFTALGYRLSSDTEIMQVRGIDAEFYVNSPVEYDRVTTMIGEQTVLEAYADAIRPDDVVWDVGANVGTYSVVGALIARDGSVVAFEPHPDNARRIDENVALNELQNVRIEQLALGDENGSARLHLHGDQAGGGQHSLVDTSDEGVEIDLVRGETFVREGGPKPNVLKIDVEGAELDVLDGMASLLAAEGCRTLFIEVHHGHGVSNEEVEARLRAAAFEIRAIDGRGSTTFLQATKPGSANESSE